MAVLSSPLKSTALAAAQYDTETQELEITFVRGNTYTHSEVPRDVYDSLITADSPGSYWHAFIKGVY